MRVSITVKRDWPKGAWNKLVTNIRRMTPKLLEESSFFLEGRARSYIDEAVGRSSKLSQGLTARPEGNRIVFHSDRDYAPFLEEGYTPHIIPIEWWGQQSSEARWITNPKGFAVVSKHMDGIHFIDKAVNDLRPAFKEIGVKAINNAVWEAGMHL